MTFNAETILPIIGDKEKLAILKTVMDQELCIQQIIQNTGIAQTSAYRKVRQLEQEGLIKSKIHRARVVDSIKFEKSWDTSQQYKTYKSVLRDIKIVQGKKALTIQVEIGN